MKTNFVVLLLFLSCIRAFAQPDNNYCSGAITIPVNSGVYCEETTEVSILGATMSGPSPSCQSAITHFDLWFEFTATSTRHAIAFDVVSGSNIPFYYALYTGDCNNIEIIGCNRTNDLFDDLVIGSTYKLRVMSTLSTSGPNPVQNTIFSVCVNIPPPPIAVSTSTYTPQQIVTDVLVNSSCVNISNVTHSATATPGPESGMGYFTENGSGFYFEDGIVLVSGYALNTPGPTFTAGYGNWPGDEDLENVLAQSGLTDETNDAVSLEFDFIPSIEHISFDFIFASHEYGEFQCNYSDAFAFLLTDMVTGATTNLAVIPNTTTPVSSTTIRDNQYNSECPSSNSEYFGTYYDYFNLLAPINFTGTTIPMTAQSNVIPGNLYHIKLVVADYKDHAFDSAVFIDAGSFNIGSPEFISLVSSNGNILCEGEETVLSANITGAYTYTWYQEGNILPGETGNTLAANEPGIYTLNVAFNDADCVLEYSITLLESSALNGTDLEIPDSLVFEAGSDGVFDFDLTAKTTEILQHLNDFNFIVTYHNSAADANEGINPLPEIYANTENPQVIYVKLQSSTDCIVTSHFSLIVLDETYTTPPPTGASDQSFTEGSTIGDLEAEGENIQWYDNPGEITGPPNTTDSDTPLPLSTALVDGTTYYASQTVYGIESVQRLAVTAHITLGTDENTFSGFTSFPNPVTDVLHITNATSLESATIHNLMGQQVMSAEINNTPAHLDLSALAKGMYFVTLRSDGAEKTIRIIKE